MSLLLWLMSLALRSDLAQPVASAPIAGVRTHAPVVALTFDACATSKQANGFDQQVFDILTREKIPATIYMTGTWAETHPAAVRQIAAASYIEIGNHSYSHARLSLLPPDRLRAQIDDTNQILSGALGRPPLSLRPPAGAWNRQVLLAAARAHLPVVLWTVVSGDAGGHVPAERMRRLVLAQTERGAIVIFHINGRGPFTKEVLSDIITGLRAKGFRFVTVSQLLSLPDAILVSAPPTHDQPERK
ncbi:MAG: polysaccharide deacetylase family protein [Polyangia bacterium]|jgi:peptidoglycan/xylan/chitin deacetylase (PgdA/CDA1 family)